MSAPFLAFPPAAPVRRRPDPAYHSLALFARVRQALRDSGALLAECRARRDRARGKWGVPPLFFFHHTTPTAALFPQPFLGELADRMPAEMLAWNTLPDLLDDALITLTAGVELRRAARTVDGLSEAAAAVADVLPAAAELAELLAIPDDQIVLAMHPEGRFGIKVRVRGIADVNQLHVLLADELPGLSVDPRLADACRDAVPDPAASVFAARFQVFRSSALQTDGTLPSGFAGSDHWLWGDESPAAVPLEKGERVLLLGRPAVRTTWAVGRKFPRVTGEVEVVARFGAADVTRWLATRCPALKEERVRVAA